MKSLESLMDLHGRVAVITGGAGHIGRAMAEALGEQGASIVLLDIRQDALDEASARLARERGVTVFPLRADLADEAEVRQVPARVLEHFGRIDILINNAALVGTSRLKGWATPFAEQSSDTWRLAMEVNVTAPFVLVQACAEALAASSHGAVVNIGSIYGMSAPDLSLYAGTSLGNPAAYAASKGALLQLTRWLSTVMAPAVRVNAITIGGVERGQSAAFQERYVAHTPLRRMAAEEDLKGAIAYLASDLSSYVTGHNLVVDGGWTAW